MSKIKRIIEIDEEIYNTIMCTPHSPVLGWSEIAKSVPYNPSGDCISREALKKAIKDNGYSHYFEIFDIIDNAQTVPLPNEQIAWEQGYEAGLAQGKHDRPHGEWVKSGKGKTTFFCSECGREIDTKPFTRPDKFPFCHCGADMRPKGGAE